VVLPVASTTILMSSHDSAAKVIRDEVSSSSPQHPPSSSSSPIRGLCNATGTACHLNAAVILFCYCFDPIITSAVNTRASTITTTASSPAPREEFILLLRNLRKWNDTTFTTTAAVAVTTTTADSNEPIDPTTFYASLRQHPITRSLQSEDFGDAVVALIRLLQHWVQTHPPPIPMIHDTMLYSGRVRTVLRGTSSRTTTTTPPTNIKYLKERTLTNPYPLPILRASSIDGGPPKTFTSLVDALQDAFCTEHVVDGYTWSNHPPNDDETESTPMTNTDTTTTTKRLHVTSIPPIFMIHLQRFTIHNHPYHAQREQPLGATECVATTSMSIPAILNVSTFLSSTFPMADPVSSVTSSGTGGDSWMMYHLQGGLLHISQDPSDRIEYKCDDSSVGHYVAVIPSPDHTQEWYVVDDDRVLPVSLEQVLLWLGGDWYSLDNDTDDDDHSSVPKSSYARGILLVYHVMRDQPKTRSVWLDDSDESENDDETYHIYSFT
jgi:Ubiquitin carboxyl-terminal hydrolase